MGVLDLFTMMAGGAWLTKEAVRETGNRGVEKYRADLIQKYIAEHTDLELEQTWAQKIDDPDCYDEVWTRLESFKRDNPVWCEQHSNKPRYSEYLQKMVGPNFGWQSIGKLRLKKVSDELRGTVLNMLMQTHGKNTVIAARQLARLEYPEPESKR